jgi:hypothetical protein
MTTKKRTAIAGVVCLALVVIARATIRLDAPFGYAGALVLFPGSIPNLLFFGVHRDWGLMGEIIMLTISAAVWFPVIYGPLGMVAKEFPAKTEAKKNSFRFEVRQK